MKATVRKTRKLKAVIKSVKTIVIHDNTINGGTP